MSYNYRRETKMELENNYDQAYVMKNIILGSTYVWYGDFGAGTDFWEVTVVDKRPTWVTFHRDGKGGSFNFSVDYNDFWHNARLVKEEKMYA